MEETQIKTIITAVTGTLQIIIGGLFLLATVVFLWGVVRFIASAGNPQTRAKAKGVLSWGIIGMAIMASAWGIAALLVDYFDIPKISPISSPPPVFKEIRFK